jgi:deoxyribonuclease-1-like protein
MAKLVLIVLVVAGLAGGAWFLLNFEIQSVKPSGWKIVPRTAAGNGGAAASNTPQGPFRPTLRIASFQLGRFDEAKLANPRVSDALVKLLPQFDLIALQGVRGRNQGVLIRLIEMIHEATGRTYDFATDPAQQRDSLEHYSAFVFDTARVSVDGKTVHFVNDPLGRFRIKPLAAQFCAKGPDPAEAFTFVLINVEVDPNRAAVELDVLADAHRAVRDSFPKEDDIIMLGDLESDDGHLGRLGTLLGVTPLVSGIATTTRGTQLLDNILLDRRATTEFTGRVEVVDMMRALGLTQADALEVSEHLPLAAEFSVYEGGAVTHALPKAN